ncbi:MULTISPECIES: TonB-dependent copper receptor [Lysobacter]|jgi:iron complex outermembrane receptor protein|nr:MULTISPECIES: TonB-dependent copper receptor [Lysobacter]
MPYLRDSMIRSSCLSVAVAMALACSLPAHAATSAGGDTALPIDLDAVVVVAAAPVSALTFETDPRLPRQPVPASDGADYLKTIPGFTAIRNGGTNGDPVLRGMFGSRLNLLSNDGAMPGACPSRMDNPMSYVSPETYDSLVVIKGPQTVLWGPGASAGTVRFSRDREQFDEPTMKLAGSLLGGSFGRNDQVLDATFGAAPGYARISANRSDSDDYRDGDGNDVASAWNKWNADLALGWTPDADTVVEASAGTGDGEARYAGRGMDGSQFKRESYGLRLEKRNLDGLLDGIETNVFYNRADHVMDNYSLRKTNPNGAMPMPMASNVERTTTGGRFAASWRSDHVEVTAGVDGQDSRHRRRSAHGRGAYRSQPWTTDARFRTVGAFAEANWHIADHKRLIAGARADRAQATDERATLGKMGAPNPTAGRTRHETLTAGFIRFEQDLGDVPLNWYAGIGHTERMPDYWELFSPNMGPTGTPNAFAGVDTEKTTQLDIGLQYRTKRVDAWVSAYAGRIDDYLLFRYHAGGMMGPMSQVTNVDAKIHGAELGVEYRPTRQWKLGGTLAQAWGANRDAGTPLPQMPPLEARLSLAWDNSRWSAGALVRAVAAQDRIAPAQGSVVGQDLGPSAGFATFAVNGGYRFNEKAQLTVGVDNVFDRTYAEHLNLAGNADFGYPADPVRIHEPGRTAWVKLNLTY